MCWEVIKNHIQGFYIVGQVYPRAPLRGETVVKRATLCFYPTALKDCQVILFTHGV